MKDSVRRRYLFFLINYFVQGSIGIVYEPLNYLLKDQLHLTPGQAAGFIGWMTFPFLLKPLFGFITDLRPILGYRRKPYMIIFSLVATLGFVILGAQTRYAYLSLLIPMAIVNFGIAFADSVCGGLLVEDGKDRHQTGPYQAIQIGALYLSMILCGFGGGWVSAHWSYRTIFLSTAVLSLAIFASTLLIHEEGPYQPRQGPIREFLEFSKTRKFWALCLTILLWNFYPFLGTVQFYYQTNVLKLSPVMIGTIVTLGSVAGISGSAVFWKLSRREKSQGMIVYGPAVMALASLSYLFYSGPTSVALIEVLFGFANVFFRLSLLDLIARSCPPEAEAATFAVFLALFDLAMYASNITGGKLYDILQRGFALQGHPQQWSAGLLILIGSACTFACRWTLPVPGDAGGNEL